MGLVTPWAAIHEARGRRDLAQLVQWLADPANATAEGASRRAFIVSSLLEPRRAPDDDFYDPDPRVDAPALPALIEALSESDVDVRRAATRVLGYAATEAAAAPLIAMIDSPDHATRMHAIAGLGRLRSRAAVPALVGCLTNRRYSEREWAGDALVNIRDAQAHQALVDAGRREWLPWRRLAHRRHARELASRSGL